MDDKMKGGDVLNDRGLELSQNDFGFEQNLGEKSTNIPFFHAVMNMIYRASDITCISWASLYGFIYRVDIPEDYQYFNYVGGKPNKVPLTSILLKVCIIEDDSKRLPAFSLNESSATSANPIKGMLTTTIDLMRSIVMNKLVQSKSYSKASVSLQELVNEVNTQQYIFKNTVGNQGDSTHPVCPSILDFFWFDKDVEFYDTFLNTLHPEGNKFKEYLSDKKIGVIAMEYAGLYGDKFITFAEFYKKYHNDEIKMQIVLISIFTNIVRLALVSRNIFHCDLHANNIYVNEDLFNRSLKDVINIKDFMDLSTHKELFISYILDFGRTITLDKIKGSNYNIQTPYTIFVRRSNISVSNINDIFTEINAHAQNNITIQDIEYIVTVFKLIDEQYQKNHPAQSSFLYSLYENQEDKEQFLTHVLNYYKSINVRFGNTQNIFNNIEGDGNSYKVVGGDDNIDVNIDVNAIAQEAVKAVDNIIVKPEAAPEIDVNAIAQEAVKVVDNIIIKPPEVPEININAITQEAVKAVQDVASQPESVINIDDIVKEAVKAVQDISKEKEEIDIDTIVKEAIKVVEHLFSEEDNSWSVKIVETEEKNEFPFNNTTTTTLTKNGENFVVKETSKKNTV